MPLITLSDYKTLLGVTSTTDDPQITALLDFASEAVENYTDRKFVQSTGVATTRSYLYDGSGFLDIDDCVSITGITVTIPNVADPFNIDPVEYTAMPSGPVFYYLILHGALPFGISPEMGFERNLDQYPYVSYKQATVNVTATWGWPTVPQAVKIATALVISDFLSDEGKDENLTSEAIEGWSRSWGGRGATGPNLAIPNKARDLLATYQRVYV